jgi:cholesterol oxidase
LEWNWLEKLAQLELIAQERHSEYLNDKYCINSVTQAHTDHLLSKGRTVCDKLIIANDVGYRTDLFEGNIMAPNTVHPLGGCVRGNATDRYGRVDGYDNLYVNDASLLPGHLGCHPFMTITALAEHNIEAILPGKH